MTLPFNDITIFLYSFYTLIAISLFSIHAIHVAVNEFKKGIDNA